MKIRGTILLFLIILFSSLCFSVSPFLDTTKQIGTLTILSSNVGTYQQNKNISLNFHVYNSTYHMLINNNTNCTTHIYYPNGTHMISYFLQTPFDSSDNDFFVFINSSKQQTSLVGFYSYIIDCTFNPGNERGILNSFYELTPNGLPYNTTLIVTTGTVTNTNTNSISNPYQNIIMFKENNKLGEDIKLYWQVKNMTNGKNTENASDCITYLYDENNNFIRLFNFSRNLSKNNYDTINFSGINKDWYLTINSSKFLIDTGEYTFKIQCNASVWGSISEDKFIVSNYAEDLSSNDNNNFNILLALALLTIICLYVSSQLNSKYKLAKLVFFIYGILLAFIIVFSSLFYMQSSNSITNIKSVFLFLCLPFVIFNGIYWTFVYSAEQMKIKTDGRLNK